MTIRSKVLLHIQGDPGVQVIAEVLGINECVVCVERMEDILCPFQILIVTLIWRQYCPPKRRYRVFLHGVTASPK